MPSESVHPADDDPNRNFATTRWSLVARAGDSGAPEVQEALEELCRIYWFPLYAYVRRRGFRAEDAQDYTQSFFMRLLEKQTLQVADPHRGRFRSFLLASLNNFLANEVDRARTRKRGGDRVRLSIDLAVGESRLQFEPAHEETPERVFHRQWALTVLETVISRLENEYRQAGKARQFELLKHTLTGSHECLPYAGIAEALGLTEPHARQLARRLRQHYRTLLREEVARTVEHPQDVDAELASLIEVLRK